MNQLTSARILNSYRKSVANRSDSRLAKYLHNKSVVIVGPDTSLVGTGMGAKIEEEFDVVVRINTAYNFVPFKKSLVKDIGKRTDIFYMAPSQIKWISKQPDQDMIRGLKGSDCSFICYQNGHDGTEYMTGKYVYPDAKQIIKRFVMANRTAGIKTQLSSSHDSCLHLSQMLSEIKGDRIITRTGLLAVWDCLVHGARSVTLMGMSFYHGGGHLFRVVPPGKELNPLKNHLAKKSPHDSYAEVVFLAQICKLFGDRIIVTGPLSDVMKVSEEQ